jgi:hypothetical protein
LEGVDCLLAVTRRQFIDDRGWVAADLAYRSKSGRV